MIKVCYTPLGGDYGVVRDVAEILEKEGIRFVFVARTRVAFEEYKKNGSETYFISEIFNQRHRFSGKELLDLELKYGPHGIRAISNSDKYLRFLFKKQLEREQFVARAYKFWEEFFDTHHIDYALTSHTALFDTRTMYNVARFRGNPPVATINAGPGDNYFTFCDMGEENYWSELLRGLAEGPKPLTEGQNRVVVDFLQSRKVEGISDAKIQHLSTSLFQHIRYMIWEWKEHRKAKLHNDPAQAATLRYMSGISFGRILWKSITQNFFHYDFPANEPYVYFPLFCENEIMNMANYHYWTQNQIPLIREIAESLPTGFKLYVKEHPGYVGSISFIRLKEIQNVPRVKVVYPSTTTQELVDNCKAVVVLNGTTGWQAYLNRKPVITLTNLTYFSRSNLVYKIGSPCELPATLFRAIKEGPEIYDKHKEEWAWFIYTVLTTCGEGVFTRKTRPYFIEDLKNSKKIAAYISEKINRDLSKQYHV